MLKRRAFLLLGSAASVVAVNEAQAFFMGGVGVSGLANLQPPSITSMTPNNGSAAGGNTVSFIGCSFSGITDVRFGGIAAANVVITNNDVMTCTAPGHANGAVNVVLTNAAGPSASVVYTYGSPPVVTSISPTQGPIAGGTLVQIFGSSFTGATEVRIGGTLATSFAFIDDAQVNCTTPPGNGVDDVVVTNPNGSGTLAAAFTYTGTYSASFPLGNFTVMYQEAGSTSSANGDGTTGWQTPSSGPQLSGWTVLQMWWNAPFDGFYKFVVPARCTAFSAIPGNSLAVWMDQAPLQYDGGTTSNLNWFMAFVSNTGATSIDYSFTGAVTAGWHSILVYLCNGAHYGLIGATNNPTHYDRLRISSTGTALPAEPTGSRNPALQPFSSYHFMNTPFGANAQFLALNSPASQTLNGTGGNGASVALNTKDFSSDIWLGEATDPVWSITNSDNGEAVPSQPLHTPYPVRAPAGAHASNDNPDRNVAFVDTANPRYFYTGIEWFQNGPRTANFNMRVLDSYNLNHAVPQDWGNTPGIIRLYDCDNGVIAHRLLGHMGFPPGNPPFGSSPGGYATALQTSQWSGMPWPGCQSDSAWKQMNEYNNPNGVPYGAVAGIHPSAVRPSGMNAATAMLWDCLANYGVWMNVTGGTYPGWGIYGESAVFNHPALVGLNWNTILPNLAVMTAASQAPIVVGQGLGGGTPKVQLVPGITQGYPSIGQAPFTFPSSPVGIPLQFAMARPGSAYFPGVFPGPSFGATVPVGSFVMVFLTLDRTGFAVNFASLTDSSTSAGAANVYSFIQPAANTAVYHPTIAYCASTTRPIPSGTTWAATLTPTGLANYFFYGAFYLTPTGTVSLRVSNNALSATGVTTLSTSLAGVQANDLVLGFTYTSSYAEINDPAGMGSLNPTPPLAQSFRYAPSTATFNYNPTWDRASAAQLVAAAFAGLGTSSTVTVTAIAPTSWTIDGGTSASIAGTGFTGVTQVQIGGVNATSFAVVSPTQIRCVVPPGAVGAKNVVVTTSSGSGTGTNLFTYATYAPTLPAISALPQILECPDPFLLNSGARCATQADWGVRKIEILEQAKYYIYGHIPGLVTVSVVSTSSDVVFGTMRRRTVVLSFACPNGALTPVTLRLWIPVVQGGAFPNGVSGSGPWPIIAGTDGSWSPLIDPPSNSQNNSIGQAALNALVSRGYIIAEIGRDDFNLDWESDGGNATYTTPGCSFTRFPFDRAGFGAAGYDWGTWGGWAWGCTNVISYFATQTSLIDTTKIGLCGHSRGSNTVELAAMLDSRIGLVACNQNGLSLFRAASNDTLSHFNPGEAGWLSPRYPTTIGGTAVQCLGARDNNNNPWPCPGNSARIPFDTHATVGLVAGTTPIGGGQRFYLSLNSNIWNLGEPHESAQRVIAAREVWAARGLTTSNCAWWLTNNPTTTGNGGHALDAQRWNTILDFADLKWYGQALPADVLPPTSPSYQWNFTSGTPVFSGLPAVYSWTHPTLT